MAMKDFDFKKYMLEKGEKVGLGIALGLTGLLLATSLFWPRSGLLAENPAKNAAALKTPTDQARTALRTELPADSVPADLLPPKEGVTTSKFTDAKVTPEEMEKLAVVGLFAPGGKIDPRRQKPEVYLPEEARVALVRVQMRSWAISSDYTKLMVIEGEGSGGDSVSNVGKAYQGGNAARASQRYRRGMGDDRSDRRQPGLPSNVDPSTGQQDKKLRTVDLTKEDLDKVKGTPAEEVFPLRAAIIAASFPYRLEVEEFRRKLRLKSPWDVLGEINDNDKTDDGDNAQGQPSFRFLGVELQRRVLDPNGKPKVVAGKTDAEGWVSVNLEGEFVDYVLRSGERTEPEDDPKLQQICFDGLVMPRLLNFREKQYPPIETQLEKIKSTLDEIRKEEQAKNGVAAPVNRFDRSRFNPWKSNTGRTTAGGDSPRPGPPGPPMPGVGPGPRPRPGPGTGPKDSRPGGEGTLEDRPFIPEACLVRLMDVTVEPGKVYQYRMRVKMANPNYKRTDHVASDSYAKDPYLTSEDWYVVPQTVTVPPETLYYAVDQKAVEGSAYKGINKNPDPDRRQTVLQIHRWVEKDQKPGEKPVSIGEWVVAERLIVSRGDYVGRRQRVEVPLWSMAQGKFVIPETGKPPRPGKELNFGFDHNDTILVDFEGGPEAGYERPGTKTILRDKDAPTEVLLYTHDGKLIAHDSATDKEDKERVDRLNAWRKRIKEVKEDKKDDGGPKIGGPKFGS